MSLRLRLLIALLAAAACVGDSPPESATPDASSAAEAAEAAEAAAPATPPSDIIAGEFIVKLDRQLTAGVSIDLGGHRVVPVLEIMQGTWLVRLDASAMRAAMPLPESTMAAIADVARVPGVRYTQPNQILEWSMTTPNDEHVFSQLWHYDQIRLREAWDLTTGPSNPQSVRVGVIDSGSTAHPDIPWAVGANFTASPPDENTVNSFTYHHGVTVAGLIGARGNNGTGVAGICWNCSIIPIRVNTPSGVNTALAASGMAWAAGQRDLGGPTPGGARHVEVVNLSYNNRLASTRCDNSPAMRDAIVAAVAAGVTIAASAGNQGFATGPTFPANCPGVIAVAASDSSDRVAAYSNRGIGVDVVAPGGSFGASDGYGVDVPAGSCPQYPDEPFPYSGTGGIVSTWSTTLSGAAQGPADHCYRQAAGTSFASPHVTGVAALMLSARLDLDPAKIKAVIRLTARPSGTGFVCSTGPGTCGAGRLDAYAAVDAINDGYPAIAETAPNFHDFGTVAGIRSRTITLTNIGFGGLLVNTAPMQLVGGNRWFHFTGTCSGQTCDRAYQLFTGGSIDTEIVCEPTAAGVQTAELVYHHTGVGQARVQLSCASNGAGALTAPSTLAIGNIPVAATGGNFVTLGNSGPNAVEITSYSSPGGVFAVVGSTVPSILSAGASANVIVLCSPLAVTSYAGSVTFTSTGGNRTVQLTCAGVVPVLSAPPNVAFGPVRVGTSLDRSIAITNAGGAPLTITAASLDPDAVFAMVGTLPLTVAAGATSNLTVRCAPPSEGLHENTLQLDSNAGTTYVGLSCSGVVPRLAVSPSTVYFGPVAVHTPRTRDVTIRNTGSGALTVTHVFASGGAFSVSTVNVVLAPGATRVVAVTCRPFTAGNLGGYLEARSDGGDRRINLACTGVEPRLDAPASLALPNAPVGGSSTATLELSNPTDVAVTITSTSVIGHADLSVSGVPSTIPPGESASISVRCAPTATGDLVGTVQVEIDGGGPTATEVQCRAVAAAGGGEEIDVPIGIDPIGPIWLPPGTETVTE